MRSLFGRTAAAICAVMISAAAFAGCASGDKNTDDASKADNTAAAPADNGGSNALQIYMDDKQIPYFVDKEGNKQMLLFTEYDPDAYDNAAEFGGPSVEYIRDRYDKNGLSFDIPEGWGADDSYGAPTLYKMEDDPLKIDPNNSISVVPVDFVFAGADTSGKIDKKFVKNYFDDLIKDGIYTDYKINEVTEGTIGKDKADVYDISLTYKDPNDESGAEDTSRTVCYIGKGETPFAVSITGNDDAAISSLIEVYKSFADSIKLPNAEQIKEMTAGFGEGFIGENIENPEDEDLGELDIQGVEDLDGDIDAGDDDGEE